MKDGIINGDGTSRLARSVADFKTRYPTYDDFAAALIAGTLPLDILFNADGWSQVPDFLNKYNLLKDATSALYGLGSDAVPDEILAFLGKYSQHWWKRTTVSSGDIEYTHSSDRNAYPDSGIKVIGYQLNVADPVSDTYVLSTTTAYTERQFEYSSNVNIDDSGNLSLVDPILITLTVAAYQDANVLKGKFYRNVTDSGAIKFMPSDAPDVTQISSSSEGQAIKGTVCDVTVETLYDDCEYQYLGVPFENAVSAPKMACGTYKGTGTYGKSNKNILDFGFVPLFVIVKLYEQDVFSTNAYQSMIWNYNNVGSADESTSKSFSLDGTKLSWYSESANYQLNSSGKTYAYIAFGI